MKEQVFILLMKDRWTHEDFVEYDRLTAKSTTAPEPKPTAYNVGDTKTDETGTWRKIDANTWELIA